MFELFQFSPWATTNELRTVDIALLKECENYRPSEIYKHATPTGVKTPRWTQRTKLKETKLQVQSMAFEWCEVPQRCRGFEWQVPL
jgi:hypothetical protein